MKRTIRIRLSLAATILLASAIASSCALMPPPAKTLDYSLTVDTGLKADRGYDSASTWLTRYLGPYSKARRYADAPSLSQAADLSVALSSGPQGEGTEILYRLRITALDGRTEFDFHIVDDIRKTLVTNMFMTSFLELHEPHLQETRMIVTQADYEAFTAKMDYLVADYRRFLAGQS